MILYSVVEFLDCYKNKQMNTISSSPFTQNSYDVHSRFEVNKLHLQIKISHT